MSKIKVNSLEGVGASTPAIIIDNASGTCTANITNNLSNRNLIINGAMNVAQRQSASTSTQGYGTVDRFKKVGSGLGNTFSQEQITLSSSDTPYSSGFRKAFRVSQDQAGTANAAGAIDFSHYIEAQNLTDSGWNYTSASSKITLQFWFRASTNQTFYAVIYTQDGTKQIYPFAFTASGNNVWTKITHTISGNSNITINNDNGTGIIIYLIPYYGTDYTDSGMNASAWNTYSNNFCPDMASTWLTAGASTFDVTGMQLEVSDHATDYEHRSYAQEYDLCRRYYEKWDGASFNPFLMAMCYQSNIAYAPFFWYPKRDVPSLEYSNISHFDRLKSALSNVSSSITNLTLTNTSPKFNYGNLYFNHDSMTGGQAILFRNSNNSGWIAISSEL